MPSFAPVTVLDRNGKERTFQPTRERNPYGAAAMNKMLREVYVEAFDTLGGMAWLVEFVRRSDENARLFVAEMTKQCRMPLDAVEGQALTIKIVTMTGEQEIDITPKKVPKEPVRERVGGPVALPHRAPEDQEG